MKSFFSVSDLYSFDTDIHFGLNTDPDQIRIRNPGFDDQNLKKFIAGNFFLFFGNQKLEFTYP